MTHSEEMRAFEEFQKLTPGQLDRELQTRTRNPESFWLTMYYLLATACAVVLTLCLIG